MAALRPESTSKPVLVTNVDPGLASSTIEALCALGFRATAVSSAEAAENLRHEPSALVVADTAEFLRELADRLVHQRDEEGGTDEQALLERTARMLSAAQPPNDHVAVLVIHVECRGAAASDAPLANQEIDRRLRACVRDRDAIGHSPTGAGPAVAHVGAGETIVLLPGLPRSQAAYKVARRLHERLSAPISAGERTIQPACTIGIAVHPGDGPAPERMLARAREARGAAESPTAGAVRFHSATMNFAAERRQVIEDALAEAVAAKAITVHYQPKIELATGRVVGAEALARWTHPELGPISPGVFIPIAEDMGLVSAIGEAVLEDACRQNKAWQQLGLPSIRVAVNLSTVQLREERLIGCLNSILSSTALEPKFLELEITESVLVDGIDVVLQRMHALRKLGVRLSIDDFGTGYSSLSYLKRFPIDTLKIDQAFVRDLTTDKHDAAITTAIVLLGQGLRLHVVAEGVETRAQLDFLRMLGCHEAQGFLFSKALPPAEFAEFLRRGVDPKLFGAAR